MSFSLHIKSLGIHIKIYDLGFLSVINHSRVGVEKRAYNKHESFQKKKKEKSLN